MKSTKTALLALGGVALMTSLALSGSAQADVSNANYGCYKVKGASALNVRRFAYSRSSIVGVVKRGDVVIKWKRFCSIRGFWCPIRTATFQGHADKRFLQKVSCS